MAWYNEDQPETLNFMVVGNCHSGHDLLQACLSAHPTMVCHGDVLHPDEALRKEEHEAYFGDSGKVSDWYQPKDLSVEQYLNNKIFDNMLFDEKAVGVRLSYDNFLKADLWDYAEQKCRQGDFCILHVARNPVACFVDYMAENRRKGLLDFPVTPSFGHSVSLEPEELTHFVRDHLATELKVNRLCGDRAVIPYHELLLDSKGTLQQIFKFLDLPYSPACVPNRKKIHTRDMKSRISNWHHLKAELPIDVRDVLESPTLF
jgi:hypothetical protein